MWHNKDDEDEDYNDYYNHENTKKEPAKCRHCGKILKGDAYMYGGPAYHSETNKRCPSNFYGGFVCSKYCDIEATLELESSFPGAGVARSPSQSAAQTIRRNWDSNH